jgi:lysophospholipase L1-like esterase
MEKFHIMQYFRIRSSMLTKFITLIVLLCLLWTCQVRGQATDIETQPFVSEIIAFEKADKQSFPPKKAIVFTGSSSIRLWNDLQQRFPGKKVINRGFGGSGLTDLIRYADRIVIPYRPRQIIIYSGENDIAAGKSAEQVFEDFKKIADKIKKNLPSAKIAYISMKPSPSRISKIEEVKKGNALIRDYLASTKTGEYINVFDPMLNNNQEPRAELFVEDNLHMNMQGYDLWTKIIAPYLR